MKYEFTNRESDILYKALRLLVDSVEDAYDTIEGCTRGQGAIERYLKEIEKLENKLLGIGGNE